VFAESSSANYRRRYSMDFVESRGRGFAVIDGGVTITDIDIRRVSSVRSPCRPVNCGMRGGQGPIVFVLENEHRSDYSSSKLGSQVAEQPLDSFSPTGLSGLLSTMELSGD
jgi:hypothetical protein